MFIATLRVKSEGKGMKNILIIVVAIILASCAIPTANGSLQIPTATDAMKEWLASHVVGDQLSNKSWTANMGTDVLVASDGTVTTRIKYIDFIEYLYRYQDRAKGIVKLVLSHNRFAKPDKGWQYYSTDYLLDDRTDLLGTWRNITTGEPYSTYLNLVQTWTFSSDGSIDYAANLKPSLHGIWDSFGNEQLIIQYDGQLPEIYQYGINAEKTILAIVADIGPYPKWERQ